MAQGIFHFRVKKTVNHGITLYSHIPDVKPRVKNSAAQNQASNPMQRSIRDNRERAPNTSPASLTEPVRDINLPCHAALTQDMRSTLWKLTASISIKNLFTQGEGLRGLLGRGQKEKQNEFKEHS